MQSSDFEREWHVFADADAQLQAPAGLLPAVMEAWDTSRGRLVQTPPRRQYLVAVATLAAAFVLAAAATTVVRDRHQRDHQPDRADADGVPAPEATPSAAAVPVLRIAADARLEGEPLQTIRVRLPRASVEAIGVAVVDSDVFSLVEVDVVVGGDGLPRAIQHVGPVPVGVRQ